ALAPERCRTRLDKVHSAEFCRQIVRDTDHNPRLAFLGDADNRDNARLDLTFSVIDKAAKILWLDSMDGSREHGHRSHLADRVGCTRLPIAAGAKCDLFLCLRKLTLE